MAARRAPAAVLTLEQRALFSCVPGFGHFHPLVPLARAFAQAGHEVSFATAPYFQEHVDAAGFPFLPAGIDHEERWARFEPFRAEHLALPLEERRAFLFPHMFGTIEAPAKIQELREIVRTWRPTLIVLSREQVESVLVAERPPRMLSEPLEADDSTAGTLVDNIADPVSQDDKAWFDVFDLLSAARVLGYGHRDIAVLFQVFSERVVTPDVRERPVA